MKISFELDNKDLQFFRRELRRAAAALSVAADQDILDAAHEVMSDVRQGAAPGFIKRRVATLKPVVQMLQDADWPMSRQVRKQALAALAYFGDPDDLIPDSLPELGFLDDAIMIELLVYEMHHHIEAYEQLSALRKDAGNSPARLKQRASELAQRADRRRNKARAGETGAGQQKVLW